MNIFAIDQDPVKAACHLHDRHVVKMILECAQLLSTTRYILGERNPNLFKPAFVNHPCTIWVRQSKENYLWLLDHFQALCNEYGFRYFKEHQCFNMLVYFAAPIDGFFRQGLTEFAQAMPDDCKHPDPVQAYRNYYLSRKIHNQYWTHRKQSELSTWLAVHLHPEQFKRIDYSHAFLDR